MIQDADLKRKLILQADIFQHHYRKKGICRSKADKGKGRDSRSVHTAAGERAHRAFWRQAGRRTNRRTVQRRKMYQGRV